MRKHNKSKRELKEENKSLQVKKAIAPKVDMNVLLASAKDKTLDALNQVQKYKDRNHQFTNVIQNFVDLMCTNLDLKEKVQVDEEIQEMAQKLSKQVIPQLIQMLEMDWNEINISGEGVYAFKTRLASMYNIFDVD